MILYDIIELVKTNLIISYKGGTQMKPDYKNWVPRGMLIGVLTATAVVGILLFIFGSTAILAGSAKLIVECILRVLFVVLLIYSYMCINWYRTFSYNGKKQFARQIIEGIAHYVVLPENGKGLDVGCGSGALTIACAKKNKSASMVGLDRWGKEYASFNKPLCESNAKIEGDAGNTSFVKGDACILNFEDETFDAVTSNYCYHNIPGKDRQEIILETLRVLKKGGTFAIHDIFTKQKYGDVNELIAKLKELGYEKVDLVDTTDGIFMTKKEARVLCLQGSALLIGRK